MAGQYPARLRGAPGGTVELPLQRQTARSGGSEGTYQGDRRDPETRVRYGYRRITVLLKREGWPVNGKRIYRLYKALGLQLRNKTPKRKVKAKLRDDRRPAARPNDIWAMDFLHDELFDGRKIRILAVVDTFSRLSPALDPRFAYKAADVVETLERIGKQVGIPRLKAANAISSSIRAACWSRPLFIRPIQDRDGAPDVLTQIRARFPWLRRIFAGGGYAGDKLRDALAGRGDWVIEIYQAIRHREGVRAPTPADGLLSAPSPGSVATDDWRRTFEKTIKSSTAWLFVASVQLMTRRLANP